MLVRAVTEGLSEATSKTFEESFDLVVLIPPATDGHMQVAFERLCERLKEVRDEFGGQFSNVLAFEFAIKDKVRTSGEIQGNFHKSLIHGQEEAIPFNTALFSQCFRKRIADGESDVFYCVMLIHVEVPPYGEYKINQ